MFDSETKRILQLFKHTIRLSALSDRVHTWEWWIPNPHHLRASRSKHSTGQKACKAKCLPSPGNKWKILRPTESLLFRMNLSYKMIPWGITFLKLLVLDTETIQIDWSLRRSTTIDSEYTLLQTFRISWFHAAFSAPGQVTSELQNDDLVEQSFWKAAAKS